MNIVEMVTLPKVINIVNVIPSKFKWNSSQKKEKISLKFIWYSKIMNSQSKPK
jgi:hypothetical protein